MGEMYGERLRLRRTARGLTQKKLAQMVGCSGHYISNIEKYAYKPNSAVSDRIEEVLGEF